MEFVATYEVNDVDFEERVVKASAPVLVDFWAPWCGPCRMAEPILEELSNEYSGKVAIAKLNVDDNPQTSEKYQVMSIPTTILIKDGKEIGRQIGFAGRKAFEDLVKQGI